MIVTVIRNRASRSGRALATALGAGVAEVGDRRSCRGDRYVINWGVSQTPVNFTQRRLTYSNFPAAVATCVDKFNTLLSMVNYMIPCIDYSTERHDATNWLEDDGKIVVRHTTTGHSGQGLQIVRRGEEIPDAPLYTRYFRKQAEYRLHVFYGRVILTQQKRRMSSDRRPEDVANTNLVRTHLNGWTFAINNLDCDTRGYRDGLTQLAVDACNAVGANHCAVDVLVNHETNAMAVCEVNSAPGIDADSTLNAYTEAFRSKIEELG